MTRASKDATPTPPCGCCDPPRHGCTNEEHRKSPYSIGSDYACAYGRLVAAIEYHVLTLRTLDAQARRPRQSKAAREMIQEMRENAVRSLAKTYAQMTGLSLDGAPTIPGSVTR